jgi:hypothetical protein
MAFDEVGSPIVSLKSVNSCSDDTLTTNMNEEQTEFDGIDINHSCVLYAEGKTEKFKKLGKVEATDVYIKEDQVLKRIH